MCTTALHTDTSASAHYTHSYRHHHHSHCPAEVKKCVFRGLQRNPERLNGVLLLRTPGEDRPEGRSDIREGSWPCRSVLQSLSLGTSRRTLDTDPRKREGGEGQRGRRGISLNWPEFGRGHLVADLFLNGKPLKLSKNGSDMICFSLSLSLSFFLFFLFCCLSLQFLQQHLHCV